MNDKITQVKNMFDAMRHDWKVASQTPSRYVGDINLSIYQKKFDLSDEDIADYCATLPMLQPQHPTCILCSQPWHSLEKKAEPICGGQVIDWYDSFEMWCAGEDEHGEDTHDNIWYHQNSAGHVSFDMEVDRLDGRDYSVRWNCNCAVEECFGKNVIYDITEEYMFLLYGPFTMEQMPYHITRPQLLELLKTSTPIKM